VRQPWGDDGGPCQQLKGTNERTGSVPKDVSMRTMYVWVGACEGMDGGWEHGEGICQVWRMGNKCKRHTTERSDGHGKKEPLLQKMLVR
jgi:hypothetical protein